MIQQKSSEDTIQLISYLYCTSNPKEEETCVSRKCSDNMCLCMDGEQLGLLLSRMFDDKEWILSSEDYSFVQVISADEAERYGCKEQESGIPSICLIKCKNVDFSDAEKEKISSLINATAPEKMRELIKALPIMKMTNVRNDIDKRESLMYICTFGDFAALFVERFMAAVIRRILDCYISGENIADSLCKLEKFFTDFLRINRNRLYRQYAGYLQECIRVYVDKLNESAYSCFSTYLEEYHNEVGNQAEKHQETVDIIELVYGDKQRGIEFLRLCSLLKQVLEIIGSEEGRYPKVLEQYARSAADFGHDFYDRLEGALDGIRESDEARKKQVFLALRNLLAAYENWADEDLDDFIAKIKVV